MAGEQAWRSQRHKLLPAEAAPVALRAQLSMFWHMPALGWLNEASTWTCRSFRSSTVSSSSTSSVSRHSFWPLLDCGGSTREGVGQGAREARGHASHRPPAMH